MKRCFVGGYAEKDNVEAVLRLKSCSEFQEKEEDDDVHEVCRHCKIENNKGYCKLTAKKIPLVKPEVLKQAVAHAQSAFKYLKEKKKKSKADYLSMEYLKTFIGNPTPVNYVLLSCGRAYEMKRKEEIDNE